MYLLLSRSPVSFTFQMGLKLRLPSFHWEQKQINWYLRKYKSKTDTINLKTQHEFFYLKNATVFFDTGSTRTNVLPTQKWKEYWGVWGLPYLVRAGPGAMASLPPRRRTITASTYIARPMLTLYYNNSSNSKWHISDFQYLLAFFFRYLFLSQEIICHASDNHTWFQTRDFPVLYVPEQRN